MKLHKKYGELLFKVVKNYHPPKMSLGRTRDAFLRDLGVPTEQYIKDRNDIYLKFCLKNEDDTPDIFNDKYQFNPEQLDEINTELLTLGDEEIEITPPTEIKNMIEESEYPTLAGETFTIDEIIKIL